MVMRPTAVAVRAVMFGPHPFVLIASPDHPLAGLGNIGKERLAQENFLVREAGSGTRMALDMYLSELPGRPEAPGVEMGSNETIKQAVMAGLGVAFVSIHTIRVEAEAGRLRALRLRGLPIHRHFHVIHNEARALPASARAFVELLDEVGDVRSGRATRARGPVRLSSY